MSIDNDTFTVTPQTIEALVQFRRAFIAWAIAEYACAIEPLQNTERQKARNQRRANAHAARDDAQIALLQTLFPLPQTKSEE